MPVSDITVTGAGDSSYNGTYTPSGTVNSATAWTNGSKWIYKWQSTAPPGPPGPPGNWFWYMGSDYTGQGTVRYYSTLGTNPWDNIWGVSYQGTSNAPTVAEATGGGGGGLLPHWRPNALAGSLDGLRSL